MNIGERFKTREGKVVTIVSFVSNETHPVVAIDDKKRLQRYTREGNFISSAINHKQDLVERV